MIKEAVRKTLTSLALLIPLVAFAEPYKPVNIDDVPTKMHSEGYMQLADRTLQYSISYQTRSSEIDPELYAAYDPDHIKYVIKDSFNLLIEFLDSHDAEHTDCRGNYNIHIFIVTRELLAESSRFYDLTESYGIRPKAIWGYYSSTKKIRANSAILVGNIDSRRNDGILVHELTHYWWDRMCLQWYWKKAEDDYCVSENFANTFEDYYKARR